MKNLIARFLLVLTFASGFAFVAHASTNAAMQSASQILVEKAKKTSDQDKSRKLLEQALVANPANTNALSGLAQYYVVAGKPAIARKYFNIALLVDPSDVNALGGRALLDLADGKRDAANEAQVILQKICATCSETRILAEKLSSTPVPPVTTKTDKPSPTDKP